MARLAARGVFVLWAFVVVPVLCAGPREARGQPSEPTNVWLEHYQAALAQYTVAHEAAKAGDPKTAVEHGLAALRLLGRCMASLMVGLGMHYKAIGQPDEALAIWKACDKALGAQGSIRQLLDYPSSKHFRGYRGPQEAFIAKHLAAQLESQK